MTQLNVSSFLSPVFDTRTHKGHLSYEDIEKHNQSANHVLKHHLIRLMHDIGLVWKHNSPHFPNFKINFTMWENQLYAGGFQFLMRCIHRAVWEAGLEHSHIAHPHWSFDWFYSVEPGQLGHATFVTRIPFMWDPSDVHKIHRETNVKRWFYIYMDISSHKVQDDDNYISASIKLTDSRHRDPQFVQYIHNKWVNNELQLSYYDDGGNESNLGGGSDWVN